MTEPTPKPTDALEHLRRLTTKEEVWSYLEAAIAAWEKERADGWHWRDLYFSARGDRDAAGAAMDRMKAILDRIAEKADALDWLLDRGGAKDDSPDMWDALEKLQAELRAAREGGK